MRQSGRCAGGGGKQRWSRARRTRRSQIATQNLVSTDISIKSGTQFGRRGGLEEQSSSLAGFFFTKSATMKTETKYSKAVQSDKNAEL